MYLKKNIFNIICIFIFAIFIIMMLTAISNINISVSYDDVKSLPTIVIDAGHGGEDGGAVNDDGVLEKDINLKISNDTIDLLHIFGFDVIPTRTTDTSLDSNEETVRLRKVSDMKKRLEIFNSSDKNIVISIHQNKFTESKYYGTQIFYSPNNSESILLADSIKFSIKGLLQPHNQRECKQADSNIYLLNKAEVPAVIVECGFISNYDECRKLLDDTYQKQISFSIISGFLNYYNTN